MLLKTYLLNLQMGLKPLVKWSGGKSDELEYIKKHIPEEYNLYLEPFVGGGSLFFDIQPTKAVISDIHQELISFYQSIKAGLGGEIYNFMQTTPNDSSTYYRIRDHTSFNTLVDVASRFYYQRKTCYRGMLRYNKKGRFNIPFGNYKKINYSDLLNDEYHKILQNTDVMCTDYTRIFDEYSCPDNFMFLDPPYDGPFTDYGYCKFDKDDHIELAFRFKNTRIKCLMVIGKTPFIEELYDGYIVERYIKNYKFKIHSGRVNGINEHLIIKNY